MRERIEGAITRAGRKPGEVVLVAVSKTVPAETVAEAAHAGLSTFGENRIQEGLGKIDSVRRILGRDQVSWHLVGHLQSNKAKAAAGRFDLIHSVDDAELAHKLDRAAAALGLRQSVLIQVNVGGETTKSGIDPGGLLVLVDIVAQSSALDLRGLMTVPPYDPDPERSRRYFAALRELGAKVRVRFGAGGYRGELSMGMTEDFETAIEEGATIVRVGRAIFGQRPRAGLAEA